MPVRSAVYCPSHLVTDNNSYYLIVDVEAALVMPASNPGEFELISRLTANLPTGRNVIQGVGDDAAVLECPAGSQLVATCDAQVEGRHFLRANATPEQIGRRALAINLSDLAAMGADPQFALVSLFLPTASDTDWLDGLYHGLHAQAAQFGVSIVGGNIAATDGPFIIDITLLGYVTAGRAALRSGARVGDRLCVTGSLGAAGAGLLTLLEPISTDRPAIENMIREVRASQRLPQPRVAEGRALVASGHITAMLDISDGLAGDLSHLCQRSGVGAVIDADTLPISAATTTIAEAYHRPALDLALYSGEDYELLFSVPREQVDTALAAVHAVGGTARTIGWVIPSSGDPSIDMRLRLQDGTERPLAARGWDHLRDNGPTC